MKWQAQVEASVLKASQVLNLLRTMKDCSLDATEKAYTALIHPLLEYATPIWSLYLHTDIVMLEKVQKRAARWVCGSSWDIYTTSSLVPLLLSSLPHAGSTGSHFMTGAHYYVIVRLTKLFMA